MNLILRKLLPTNEYVFKLAFEEFNDDKFKFASDFDPSLPFQDFLKHLDIKEDPSRIPPDRVPTTFMCAFFGNEIVGRVSIRHGLSKYIEEVGGHIGFGVLPRFRGMGIAKKILIASLEFCRDLGLTEVLLTCDDENIASRKAIEASGGIFQRFCVDSGDGVKKRRYWINTN